MTLSVVSLDSSPLGKEWTWCRSRLSLTALGRGVSPIKGSPVIPSRAWDFTVQLRGDHVDDGRAGDDLTCSGAWDSSS